MSLDYRRHLSEAEAINRSLHDIDAVLKQHGLSCPMIGLPAPTGILPEGQPFDPVAEAEEADRRIAMLNEKQLDAFTKIMAAVDDDKIQNRHFYLDGPGGSGKTFIYTTLMAFIRGKNQTELPFATTGISATLLKRGRTVHSGFKLPVPILDNSVSSMRGQSSEAAVLHKAKLILIDEITMLPKHGLRCIHMLLCELMGNEKPFGGKVLLIGGDFRQTLPVVERGTRTDIIETCIC